MRNSYILDVRHRGKRSLGRFRFRWEGNIKTGLREIMWEGVG
jgi:hypothetical protein